MLARFWGPYRRRLAPAPQFELVSGHQSIELLLRRGPVWVPKQRSDWKPNGVNVKSRFALVAVWLPRGRARPYIEPFVPGIVLERFKKLLATERIQRVAEANDAWGTANPDS